MEEEIEKVEKVEEVPPLEEESDDPMGLGLGSLTVSNIRSLANTQVYTHPLYLPMSLLEP